MSDKFMESVYLTLTGELEDEYCVPGVEDLYAEGEPCERRYSEMLEAYERLLKKLGGGEFDPDAEIMINALLAICKEVGYAMYRCGAKFTVQGKPDCDK